MNSGEDGKNGRSGHVVGARVPDVRRSGKKSFSPETLRHMARDTRDESTLQAHIRSCSVEPHDRYICFLARCLEYLPQAFLGDHPAEALILNYLARMEDVHAAFPNMARNAADPYKMADLIPR